MPVLCGKVKAGTEQRKPLACRVQSTLRQGERREMPLLLEFLAAPLARIKTPLESELVGDGTGGQQAMRGAPYSGAAAGTRRHLIARMKSAICP